MRTATVERKTRETEIAVSLDLDGTGEATSIPASASWTICWRASPAIP